MGSGTEREDDGPEVGIRDGDVDSSRRIAPAQTGFSISPVAPAKVTEDGKISKPRGRAVAKRAKTADTETTAIEGRPARVPRKLLIPGTLDHAFHLVGGRDVAISLTRLGSHTSPEFAEFIRLYDELTPVEQGEPGLLERLCLCIGLHPSDYFGRLASLAYKRNFDVAHFAAAVSAPLVVEKMAKYAQQKDGFKDRQLLLQVTGHAQRGPLVQVNQTSDNRSVTVNGGGPSFEELTAKVSELIRGSDGAFIDGGAPDSNSVLGDSVAQPVFEAEVVDLSPRLLTDKIPDVSDD